MTDLISTTSQSTHTRRTTALGIVGAVGMGAGLLGAAHASLLVAYPPAVADDSYTFPFRLGGFVASQSVLTARDLALAILITGLFWTPVARSSVSRVGLAGAALSMLVLAGLEVVSVAVGESIDAGTWYGLASFGMGLGLTITGVSAARAPMRSPWLRFLPLTLGVYVFAILTPGILAGFAPGQVVIAGWMLLFAGLGRELVTTPPVPSQPSERDLRSER